MYVQYTNITAVSDRTNKTLYSNRPYKFINNLKQNMQLQVDTTNNWNSNTFPTKLQRNDLWNYNMNMLGGGEGRDQVSHQLVGKVGGGVRRSQNLQWSNRSSVIMQLLPYLLIEIVPEQYCVSRCTSTCCITSLVNLKL